MFILPHNGLSSDIATTIWSLAVLQSNPWKVRKLRSKKTQTTWEKASQDASDAQVQSAFFGITNFRLSQVVHRIVAKFWRHRKPKSTYRFLPPHRMWIIRIQYKEFLFRIWEVPVQLYSCTILKQFRNNYDEKKSGSECTHCVTGLVGGPFKVKSQWFAAVKASFCNLR